MRDGFISVAAGTPKIRVADCRYNAEQIFTLMREADKQGVKVLALPELCLTGYTCGDLFLQDTLLRGAEEGLQTILEATRNLEIVTALGLPVWDKWDNKLYNCAAIIQKGEILGLIPKVYLPNYGEFYEQRWFASGSGVEHGIELCGQHVSLCTNQTFACDTMPNLVIGVEICEDLWAPAPPSVELARKGATVILNLSASNELVGKADYRRSLVTGQSARLMCGYVYADAGEGESTTDVVFTGHNMIAENGTLLAERRFATGLTVSEIDVDRLIHDRRRTNTFTFGKEPPEIWRCGFTLPVEETRLTRYVSPSPFVPEDAAGRAERCEEILRIASLGLKKRLEHTGAKTAVVGLSGGLDSTLALLVCHRAAQLMRLSPDHILAVTMPGFGTSDRTHQNALDLPRKLGMSTMDISIVPAVGQHLADIGHPLDRHDVTYENAQARERTQILLDLGNQIGGIAVGTGDLTEEALGWCTFGGDALAGYNVNVTVPKTAIRRIVAMLAEESTDAELTAILRDILDTPISPELLPPDESGSITQKTEEILGDYEVHDFYLYYFVKYGFSPKKLLFYAENAFDDRYTEEQLRTWLATFLRRFVGGQFKRSVAPEAAAITDFGLSSMDFSVPSDMSARTLLRELEN